MTKYVNIVLLMLLTFSKAISQNDSVAFIRTISKVEQSQITLRWAPSTSISWYLSLTKGYSIERAVNKQGDSTMSAFVMLEPKRLPWPKERWQKDQLASYDNFCIIAAELLYGKGTSVNASSKILQKADEFQNKYTYAMMSADFSAQAADALGLSFIDTDVKPGYVYVYRIKSLASQENYIINPSTIVCYPSKESKLIPPDISQIKSMDKSVKILWDREQGPNPYVAYYIEKSADGKNYKRLNNVPYLSGDNIGNNEFKQFHVYIDSVDQNYIPYYYRIIGLSPFGELSTPGNYEISFGVDLTPPSKPDGLQSKQLGPNKVKLSWNFPESENKEISGFLIGRSVHVLDSFANITPIILPPDSREYIDENANPLKPNFYFVTAIDTAQNYNISLSHYAQLIDSIPPAPPVDVFGTIDTNGIVTLTWKKNSEPDILGYEVHFSNQSDHVFASLTNSPVPTNSFTDTIMIRTLTEHIYYKIVAVDNNYNYSSYSKMLELERPDIVRPAVALIADFEKTDEGVLLKWVNSTSKDVVGHSIYRTENPNIIEWTQVYTCTNLSQTTWVDENVKPMTTYYYKIHAFDEVQLQSIAGNKIKVITNSIKVDVSNLEIQAKLMDKQVHLTWTNLPNVRKYIVYKKGTSGKYITLSSTAANNFIDKDYDKDASYVLRCIANSGVYSAFSREAKVIN
ncbi:MAG: hypothetical protein IPH94_13365 [Saprospiraceae bacterium]|nr:hypothetical protein [Saprospiraceae bacterium]MBK7788163.1 hypothetical protein [Saprospiraceae bacterium]